MKNLYKLSTLLILAFFISGSVNTILKAQATLNPVADTYVLEGSTIPSVTDTLIRVRSSATGSTTVKRNGFVRYDISTIKGTLTKAEIAVMVQLAASTSTTSVLDRFDLHQVDDTWDAATLVFGTQPSLGALIKSLENIARVKAADFPKPVYKLDVTDYVKSKLDAKAKLVSFALSDDANSAADLRMYSSRCLKNNGQKAIQLILTGVTTDIKTNGDVIPTEFTVEQNYPNPFNPSTLITFAIPKNEMVQVAVYNLLGQKITTLFEGSLNSGVHQYNWNGKNDSGQFVNSGIYFTRVQFGNISKTIKMMLTK